MFLGLINGAYALPAIMIGIIYLWIHLTPEEIERVKDLEPLMNSSIGIAFSFVVAMSFVFNLVGKLKGEIKDVFTRPIREMTEAMLDIKSDVRTLTNKIDSHINKIIDK